MSSRSFIPLLSFLALLLPHSFHVLHAAVTCDSSQACFPWASPSCTRGNNINIRFFMEAAKVYTGVSAASTNFMSNRTLTWAFCPRVDELQAFNLSKAPVYAAISPVNNATFVTDMSDKYVSVYGFGDSNSRLVPRDNKSAVMIARNGSDVCTAGGDSVLLVEFLVMQVSMTNGAFAYPDAVAAYGNSSGVSVQPTGTGFQPTCTAGVCQLDSSKPCIGPAGYQNCATCYYDPLIMSNKTVQVWFSYYGTDNNGRRMLSGSSNPLNFRQYSGGSVYSTLSNSLDKVSSGQSLDPTLNQ